MSRLHPGDVLPDGGPPRAPIHAQPGRGRHHATIQLFTDYYIRLMRYVEFMKRVVPMHDDLFDFMYEALPGYEEVGRRRVLLGCWGSLNDPDHCDFNYRNMTHWGRKMFVTPGVVVDGKLVTNDLVEINLGIRILLGHSFYRDWEDQEVFVTQDPLGNPVDRRHPWNQHTIPAPQKRDFDDKYSWTMSPRWYDGTDHLPLDTGGGPLARLWADRAVRAGRLWFRQVHRAQRADQPAAHGAQARGQLRVAPTRGQGGQAAVQRDRAQPGADVLPGLLGRVRAALHREGARGGARRQHEDLEKFIVPDEAISCGFTEAVRGVLSHHMVIRGGKIANYHPYPPTPWNGSVRDSYGTPGPYEDAVQNTPIFEENGRDKFKGIDIMRAVRSFDPCLPCGCTCTSVTARSCTRCTRPVR